MANKFVGGKVQSHQPSKKCKLSPLRKTCGVTVDGGTSAMFPQSGLKQSLGGNADILFWLRSNSTLGNLFMLLLTSEKC